MTTGRPSASAASPVQRLGQRETALGRVQLGRESLGGDGVVVELAVRVAAGGEHEHCAATGGVQVALVDAEVAGDEPDEHDEQLARTCIEPRAVELRQPGSRHSPVSPSQHPAL